MYSLLFHKDVFMPVDAKSICNELQKNLTHYFYSAHFQEHLDNQVVEDRSHTYLKDIIANCLATLKTTQREVFEVELSKDFHFFKKPGWFITKYCCRVPYSDSQDLVVVIRPKYNEGVVVDNMIVTAWLNDKNDAHFTLDASKYSKELR